MSLDYIPDFQTPAIFIKGQENTLRIVVKNRDGTVFIDEDSGMPCDGNVKIYDGGTELLSTDFSAGDRSILYLAADLFDNSSYDSDILVVWRFDVDEAIPFVDATTVIRPKRFRQSAYLERNDIYPVITDADITGEYPEIIRLTQGADDGTDFATEREKAFNEMLRWYVKTGRRPSLVLDSWSFVDLHLAYTLVRVCRKLWTTLQDLWWKEQHDHWQNEVTRQQDTLTARYDTNESGTIDQEDRSEAAIGVIRLNAPNRYDR